MNDSSHAGFLGVDSLELALVGVVLAVGIADEAADSGEVPLELLGGRGLEGDSVGEIDDLLVLLEQDRLVVAHQGLQLRVVVGLKLVMLAAQKLLQIHSLVLIRGSGTILN